MKQCLITLLGSPVRIALLKYLHENSKNVQELTKLTGLTQSALSQHLAKLRAGSVVNVRRVGKHRYYSLADKKYGQLADLMQEFDEATDSHS